MKNTIIILLTLLPFVFSCEKKCEECDIIENPGYVMDIEGNVYHTVVIGNQVWMAENLRTMTWPDGTKIERISGRDFLRKPDKVKGYMVYNDSSDFEEINGLLYTEHLVLYNTKINNENKVQGLCPTGWHLPTNTEWDEMTEYIVKDQMPEKAISADSLKKYRDYVAEYLKSTWGWQDEDNGNDMYGLSLMPTGIALYIYGTTDSTCFEGINYMTGIFTISISKTGDIYQGLNNINNNKDKIYDYNGYINTYVAGNIRCIKN